MPDLDQILAADAETDAVRWPTVNGNLATLDEAFDRALGTVRYRRVRAAAVSVAAIAVVGSTAAWAAGRASDRPTHHPIRLAAYDHTVGTVPGDPESIYVVGPQDRHTAECTVVPGATVTLSPSRPDSSAPSGATMAVLVITQRAGHDVDPENFSTEYPVGADWPAGPYYLFTCPTS
jgi:hypothetical protein